MRVDAVRQNPIQIVLLGSPSPLRWSLPVMWLGGRS